MFKIWQLALRSGSALIAAGLALSGFGSAYAQEGTDVIELDPIVLEAIKRFTTEEELPISTQVLTEKTIPPSARDPVADIARQTPGTNYMDFGRFGESYLTMRGIATLGSPLNPLDNTVGFSVDGVPWTLSSLGVPLLDVDHVEVLEGPQGTIFGRNAAGGAINIVSRPADGESQRRIDAEIGTDGHAFLQGTLGGWIIPDAVAGRGVLRWNEFDGDIPNTIAGGTEGGSKIGAARGALRFTPDETLTIDVSGSYSHDDRHDSAFLWLESPDFPESGSDIMPENERENLFGTVKVAKELDNVTLTSVTGYQDVDYSNWVDFTDTYFLGAAGYPSFATNDPTIDKYLTDEGERIFNQELRVNSNAGSAWQWVLGANYLHSDYSGHRTVNSTYWPIPGGITDNRIESQTFAAFGDVAVPIDSKWEISGGLRLAHDEQTFDGQYDRDGTGSFYPTVPSYSQDDRFSDTYLTGRMALSYKWSDDITTYVSAARGYSSGGFEKASTYAAFGTPSVPFEPAKVWTYELGAKAALSAKLRLNAAFFYNDAKDGQLSGFDPLTYEVYFANQDYQSYGLKAGFDATLVDGLDVSAVFSLIEASIGNVETGSRAEAAGAVEGNDVPQIPAFAASLGASYRFDAGIVALPGNFLLQANYQYVGERAADVANSVELEGYNMVDAKIGWEGEHLSIYAFGRNLLDERPLSYAYALTGGVTGAYVGRGRIVGIGMSTEW
jgi:iron complex outermembrane receptor protein